MTRKLLVLCLLLTMSSPAEGAGREIFVVERTTNRNRVVYEADLGRGSPVRAFWRMFESDGHEEALTALERGWYGAEIRARAPAELRLAFRALPALELSVREKPGVGPAAFVRIDGVEHELTRVFLRLSGGFFPALRKAELDCLDGSGAPLHFEISPH